MKRRVLMILLSLVLFVSLGLSAGAETPCVMDASYLLTEQEVVELEAQCLQIQADYGFTPYIVTTDSLEGLTADEFAGYYYDGFGCEENGILLLICLEEGEWYVLTNGECHEMISDSTIDAQVPGAVIDDIRDGEYFTAFCDFLSFSVEQMEQGRNPAVFTTGRILISIGGGLLIALIVVLIMKAGMKTVRANNTANYYVRDGSMNVNFSRDIYLYSTVTRVRRSQESSGSSGGSRGGSGGKI